ncbi:MAG: type II toxin-antitoxin system VapC family toxin [Polyangiaceae bacterium]|nr:type II toxin-antitoxin system VapC family toxin [Polyangiaceae bacterium]
MIVLDTNVLSELMSPTPSKAVTRWVSRHPASVLYSTTITQAEILYGILLLPSGRRRKTIAALAEAMFEQDFAGRLLAFDSRAARAYAEIAVSRRRSGRPISHFDAQIAAIARAASAAVATRNVADFDGCGVEVVDPWI